MDCTLQPGLWLLLSAHVRAVHGSAGHWTSAFCRKVAGMFASEAQTIPELACSSN